MNLRGPLQNQELQLRALQKRLEHDARIQRAQHTLRHLSHLPGKPRRPSLLRRFVRFLRGGGD